MSSLCFCFRGQALHPLNSAVSCVMLESHGLTDFSSDDGMMFMWVEGQHRQAGLGGAQVLLLPPGNAQVAC
jgi:hypothetical protein